MEGSNLFGLLLMVASGLIFVFWTLNVFVQPYTTPSVKIIDMITLNRYVLELGPIALLGVFVALLSSFMMHG